MPTEPKSSWVKDITFNANVLSVKTINGETYDAEFQIFGFDIYNRKLYCSSGVGALSVLLKVDDSQDESPFWATWVGSATFNYDLNLLFPK